MGKKKPPMRKPSRKTGPTKKPEAEVPETPEVPELQLTALEVKEIDLLQARKEAQNYALESLLSKEALLGMKHKQEIAELRVKQLNTKNSMKQIAQENNAFLRGIEDRLGITLADYAIREDGSLTLIPSNETGGEEQE